MSYLIEWSAKNRHGDVVKKTSSQTSFIDEKSAVNRLKSILKSFYVPSEIKILNIKKYD